MVRLTKDINECVNSILRSNIVAFPTETVFGLGANIYDKIAVDKIFNYKNRPTSNPLIVHIDNINKIDNLIDLDSNNLDKLKNIMNKLTPGPISFLLPKSKNVPDYVTGNTPYVCIRIPSNTTALKFIEAANVPICAPSANIYTHVSPTKCSHVISEFPDKKFLVLDDLYEDTVIGIESTIIKINFDTKIIDFIRPGFITPSMIMSICPKYDFSYNYLNKENIPGSGITHYSINKHTYIVQDKSVLRNIDLENISIIEFGSELQKNKNYYSLSKKNNYIDAMQNFYEILRLCESDSTESVYICINKNEDNHFYIALFNRIIRCANNKFFKYINNKNEYNLKKY